MTLDAHVSKALARMLDQDRDQANDTKLVTIFAERFANIEAVLEQIATEIGYPGAAGWALDTIWGPLLDLDRVSGWTDAVYAAWLNAKLLALRSSGTTPHVQAVAEAIRAAAWPSWYDADFSTMPPWDEFLPASNSDVYVSSRTLYPHDDAFDGVALATKWTTHLAGTTAAITVSGGRLAIDPQDATAVGLAAAPSRVPGPSVFERVTGDFDVRMRLWLRNAADSADFSAGTGYLGLLIAETIGSATNWIGWEQGYESGANRRVRYNVDAAGALNVTSEASTGDLHSEYRIVRTGQSFALYYRAYNASVALSSGTGWTLVATLDRTANPLATALYAGINVRASAAGATGLLALVEEFYLHDAIDRSGRALVVVPGASAVGYTASPNRGPGPWGFRRLTGDFDVRATVQLSDQFDTGDPPGDASRDASLYVATTSGVTNWFQVSLATSSSAPTHRINWVYDPDGTGVFVSSSITAPSQPLLFDLRITRVGQIFTSYYRPYSASVALSDGTGWVQRGVAVDRTATAVAATMQAGIMLRTNAAPFANSRVYATRWYVSQDASVGSSYPVRVLWEHPRGFRVEIPNVHAKHRKLAAEILAKSVIAGQRAYLVLFDAEQGAKFGGTGSIHGVDAGFLAKSYVIEGTNIIG